MGENYALTITPAKGRSMLTWEGKHDLQLVSASTAHLIETFSPLGEKGESADARATGLPVQSFILHGDNKDGLTYLLANGYRGRVKLVYIDPPFDTGSDYARKVTLRGSAARLAFNSSAYHLGEQVQYTDAWANDSYLQFMYERLLLLRELLSEDGTIWLHCDYRRVHYLRLLLEEVFGAENYLNTISWRSQTARGAKVNAFYFPLSTQYIEVFAKNRSAPPTWNILRKQIIMTENQAAAAFMHDEHGYFRTSDPGTYTFESLKELHAAGRLYAPFHGQVMVDEQHRHIYCSNGGNIGVKYYLRKVGRNRYAAERGVDNLWDDVPGLGTTPGEDLGYPTQKTEALLRRIISVSTKPGDLVLDCFAGSGTTAAAAQKLERSWIACDSNRIAIQTITKRLQWIMQHQVDEINNRVRTVKPNRREVVSIEPDPDLLRPYMDSALRFIIYRMDSVDSDAASEEHAHADVVFERCEADGLPYIKVSINEFNSPAIVARLKTGVRHPESRLQQLTDWRMLVDSVMIDHDYDGTVFNVTLSDAPHKRNLLVNGEYLVAALPRPATVAVKITDVLGQDVLVTQRI